MSTKPFFLKDVKKYYVFIFWCVWYLYFWSRVLLMLCILLTQIFRFCRFSFSKFTHSTRMFLLLGGFFWTWIETFWVLEPFLRRLQKILHFHFSTCPICIFHKGNLTNAICFVDKNGYALLIFFSKNPSTIRMFLRLRGFLFEIVWTHFFPETFS